MTAATFCTIATRRLLDCPEWSALDYLTARSQSAARREGIEIMFQLRKRIADSRWTSETAWERVTLDRLAQCAYAEHHQPGVRCTSCDAKVPAHWAPGARWGTA